MTNHAIIGINEYGGLYEIGRARSQAQWISIVISYKKIMSEDGKCSVRRLAKYCTISRQSARKAIDYYEIGVLIPHILPQGHVRSGVGCMYGLTMRHYAYIYEIYI